MKPSLEETEAFISGAQRLSLEQPDGKKLFLAAMFAHVRLATEQFQKDFPDADLTSVEVKSTIYSSAEAYVKQYTHDVLVMVVLTEELERRKSLGLD